MFYRFSLTLLFIIFNCSIVSAATIELKSGETFTGSIIEQDDDSIKVDRGFEIPITYYLDEVRLIDGKPASTMETVVLDVVEDNLKKPGISLPLNSDRESLLNPVKKMESTIAEQGSTTVKAIQHQTQKSISTIETKARGWLKGHSLREDALTKELPTGFLYIGLVIYIFTWIPVWIMAHKLGYQYGWMALFPIVQFYVLLKLARRSGFWILVFLIPLANILFFIFTWMDIAQVCGKPRFLGVVMVLLPVFYIPIEWYFALTVKSKKAKRSSYGNEVLIKYND